MPRILVADDNTNIQKMVLLAFQERGIEVTSVGNGEAAVRCLPDLNPDLILADIFMPVRNGYELCEWVKKETQYSHIPVILLVGAFDPLDEKEARRVGADGVLKKPFIPPDPLIAMVISVLEKNPRIAAEIAKARETPVPPPPATPATVRTAPKINPEPVPESPGPSADDATIAYGFGTGRRGLDEEEIDEPAAARAPKAGSETETQEEFDGASTASDWRRSAMEFEVSEEAARRPAFSSDEYAESSFPSERDLPSRHIPAPDPVSKIEPSAEQDAPPAGPEERRTMGAAPIANPVEEEAPVAASTRGENADAQTSLSESAVPNPDIQEAPAVESAADAEPGFASRSPHWMDLMTSSPGHPNRDWLSSVKADTTPVRAGPPRDGESTDAKAPQNNEGPGTTEGQTETGPKAAAVAEEGAQPVGEPGQALVFAGEIETSEGPSAMLSAFDEPAFAIESFTEKDENRGAEGNGFASEVAEGTIPQPALTLDLGSDLELVTESLDRPTLSKDPALIEPLAVHVTPEPLLIDESPSGPVTYGDRDQDIAPPYVFLSASRASASEEPQTRRGWGKSPSRANRKASCRKTRHLN